VKTIHKADAIIVAAGSGSRFGSAKQFAMLGDLPLYQHSLKTFAEHPLIVRIILVIPADSVTLVENQIYPLFHGRKAEIALGGATRQDSIFNGMQKLEDLGNPEIVIVHDAARPYVSPELITNVIAGAANSGAAIAALPVTDTLKHAADGFAASTLSRENIWRAQTPQAARYELLKQALENAHAENYSGTDEAELLERIGIKPLLVLGSEKNVKITYQQDLI
jgi:2-C-methyl-D-erythritol 4-phosphate cytidylyltransferase